MYIWLFDDVHASRCLLPVLLCSYRTLIRPSFKVTYKQVTALEWRCCPGFVGEECREGEFLFFPLSRDVRVSVVPQELDE